MNKNLICTFQVDSYYNIYIYATDTILIYKNNVSEQMTEQIMYFMLLYGILNFSSKFSHFAKTFSNIKQH